MNSRLRLIYNKEFVAPSTFLLRVTVDPVNTDPSVLDTCLVVMKGSSAVDEYLARVATYADLVTLPLYALPSAVNKFSSAGYEIFSDGDIITITTYPQAWTTYFGITGDVVVTIDETDPLNLVVVPPLPAFGKGLTFTVNGGSTEYTDGLANRDYSLLPGSAFLATDAITLYSTFDAAESMVNALAAQAQSLVNAMNVDTYSGIDTEDYVRVFV